MYNFLFLSREFRYNRKVFIRFTVGVNCTYDCSVFSTIPFITRATDILPRDKWILTRVY